MVERLCALHKPDLALCHSLRRLAAADAGAPRALSPSRHADGRGLRALAAQRDGRGAARLVRRLVGLLSLQDAAAAERRAARTEQASARGARTAAAPARGIRPRCSDEPPNCWCSGFAAAPAVSARRSRWSSAAWGARRAPSTCGAPTSATSASTSTKWISRCRACRPGCSSGSTSKTSAAGASPTTGGSMRRSIPRCGGCSASLPDGVCPLFFPIVVGDKAAAARALQQRGVDALEFWNESIAVGRRDETGCALPAAARPRVADSPGPRATAPRARGARGIRAVTQAGRVMTPLTQAVRSPHGDASPLDSRGNDRHRLGTDDAPPAVERPSPRERGRRSVPYLGMAARLVDAPWRVVVAQAWSPCATGDELIAIAPFRVARSTRCPGSRVWSSSAPVTPDPTISISSCGPGAKRMRFARSRGS